MLSDRVTMHAVVISPPARLEIDVWYSGGAARYLVCSRASQSLRQHLMIEQRSQVICLQCYYKPYYKPAPIHWEPRVM